MILRWHEDAEEEYASAAVPYEQQVENLGERFIGQVESAMARVFAAPLLPHFFEGECRKVRRDKFPYSIIYRVSESEIQVVALMHMSRRPEYWKRRLDG